MKDLVEFIHQVDYVMSQIDESNMPSEKSMFNWFFRGVQEVTCINWFIHKIRDSDPDTPEGKRLRTMTKPRAAIKREIQFNQIRSNNAAMKNSASNSPIALAEARIKEEEARQQKADQK